MVKQALMKYASQTAGLSGFPSLHVSPVFGLTAFFIVRSEPSEELTRPEMLSEIPGILQKICKPKPGNKANGRFALLNSSHSSRSLTPGLRVSY